jgi:hypothetical protein
MHSVGGMLAFRAASETWHRAESRLFGAPGEQQSLVQWPIRRDSEAIAQLRTASRWLRDSIHMWPSRVVYSYLAEIYGTLRLLPWNMVNQYQSTIMKKSGKEKSSELRLTQIQDIDLLSHPNPSLVQIHSPREPSLYAQTCLFSP